MTRTNTTRTKQSRQSKKQTAGDAKADGKKKPARKDGMRETVESVVVAFILAFLFRTFEAEAFVIPTGSMAPTLYGRHKEIECEKCGYLYAIGASDEVDKDGYFSHRIQSAYCPNCRYEMPVEDLPVFKGDRILVNKFPFEYGDPRRWDVVVFKYPEEPQTNYIKRLVGLPGETLRIEQGNVYAMKDGQWRILHKDDPGKQRALQILVYDNDHPETALHEQGWPLRWAPVRRDDGRVGIAGWAEDDFGWTENAKQHSFQLDRDRTGDGEFRWIRYRHIVPTDEDWRAVDENPPAAPPADPRPQLIADFCGYNAYTGGVPTDRGHYWVGDLTLSCELELLDVGPEGVVLLELNEGVRWYRCRIDVSTGKATLSHKVALNESEEEEQELAVAKTALDKPGVYELTFANVDDRLCLWVDGRLVDFDADAEYKPYGDLRTQPPAEADLIPAGIAARDVGVRVSHLLIERDVYYRNEFTDPGDEFQDNRFHGAETIREYDGYEQKLRDLLSDPQAWFEEYDSQLSLNLEKFQDIPFTFELGPDEYFMMGDNSPRSKDSRLWTNARRAKHRHAVPRSALVGKAFYVYWPHGVPFMNGGQGYPVFYHERRTGPNTKEKTDYPSFRIPFYPHVTRMHRVR